jgi:multidrug resistance efflux pump
VAPPPVPTVEVIAVIQQDTPIYSEWVATLDGYVNAQIQPHVSGYIIKQNYREGSVVSKGEVLFEIDPRPFKAVLDQAKAQLHQIATAKANVVSSRAQLRRFEANVSDLTITAPIAGTILTRSAEPVVGGLNEYVPLGILRIVKKCSSDFRRAGSVAAALNHDQGHGRDECDQILTAKPVACIGFNIQACVVSADAANELVLPG